MREEINFNSKWNFSKDDKVTWQRVMLPHTINIEDLNQDRVLRKVVHYRKEFDCCYNADKEYYLEFDGAMIVADVYVNGKRLIKHEGGYTPFVLRMTNVLINGKNTVEVKLDNREKPNVPPGRLIKDLDFLYYSGIYRDVRMVVVDKVHISNPIYANKVGSGGINISTVSIDKIAKVSCKVDLANYDAKVCNAVIKASVMDGAKCVAESKSAISVDNGGRDATMLIDVPNAKLWSCTTPNLYIMKVDVVIGDEIVDTKSVRFGIRIAEVRGDGFYLNNELIDLTGTNRHQQYPYLGIAASNEAQYRDAYKIKQMGSNIIRLSHYAHATAFYDACDELGIILINQVPGWQYCRRGKFRKLTVKNTQDMVRRDRNHASMLVMETGLNETVYLNPGATDKFFQQLVEVSNAESKALQYGNQNGRKDHNFVQYDLLSCGWDEKLKNRPLDVVGVKGLIPEYGDYEFGASYSSSRADRGDSENDNIVQAWNFQWSHNQNRKNPDSLGDLTWESIDHVRGYDRKDPISKSGMMDIFRYPKLIYRMYETQEDNNGGKNVKIFPCIFAYQGQEKIMFYSNADEIMLFGDGKLIATQTCDKGSDSDFIPGDNPVEESVMYWTKNGSYLKTSRKLGALARHALSCLQDGGNSCNMKKPPFTFAGLGSYQELKAVAVVGGKEVEQLLLPRIGEVVELRAKVDYSNRKLVANDNDFVFVYVEACDQNGQIVPSFVGEVEIIVNGGSAIYNSKYNALSGVATFMVKANNGIEKIVFTASGKGVGAAVGSIECVKESYEL